MPSREGELEEDDPRQFSRATLRERHAGPKLMTFPTGVELGTFAEEVRAEALNRIADIPRKGLEKIVERLLAKAETAELCHTEASRGVRRQALVAAGGAVLWALYVMDREEKARGVEGDRVDASTWASLSHDEIDPDRG